VIFVLVFGLVGLVFNANFNNISFISSRGGQCY